MPFKESFSAFLFTVMYGLGTLTSQALYAFLSSKCSRMKILKICMAAVTAGYILLLGFGYVLPKNLILLNAVGFGIFFFQGLYNLAVIVMLNNTIEYDEYRFSERHDSVISAVRSFSVKLAGALNQGISALVLILSGIYVTSQGISELEIEVGKGTLTSESALSQANEAIAAVRPWQNFALRLGMVLIPVLTLLAAYLLGPVYGALAGGVAQIHIAVGRGRHPNKHGRHARQRRKQARHHNQLCSIRISCHSFSPCRRPVSREPAQT